MDLILPLRSSLSASPTSLAGTLGASLLCYVFLVRSLRWRRYNAVHQQYERKWKEGKLTVAEAQRIMHVSSLYDMPWLLVRALSFALFKTYAVPEVSKLLLQTRQLGSAAKVAKRYADTEILIQTWIGCPINGFHDLNMSPEGDFPAEDPRASIAIARTNFIHSKYNIPNDQYLFTLGLFIMEPAAWAKRFGWRSLSPMEEDSYFIFWRDVGQKMGITDIPPTLKELQDWCENYAETRMVPDETNKEVAYHTTQELICAVPKALGLKAFAERVVITLLDDKLRLAFMLPKQPEILHRVVGALLTTVGLFQGYLCLPRRDGDSKGYPIDFNLPKPDASGEIRQRPAVYRSTPWYAPVPEGFAARLWNNFLVTVGWYNTSPSADLFPKGYRLEEIGPKQFENAGIEKVMRDAAKIQGCPIPGLWQPKASTKV